MRADSRRPTTLAAGFWRALVVSAVPLILGGCDWFTDMRRQPKIDTWEQGFADTLTSFRANPQESVPMTGTPLAGYQVSYQPLPGVIDSIGRMVLNPVSVDERSLANGRKYYQINCAVCHGVAGMGNGEATKFGMPGINLLTETTRGRSDGYIWGMMRNGRGLMPPYNRIEEMDRWDVVNYLRALQGKTAFTPATGPLGVPGETGDKVPGATRTGPQVPAAFYHGGGAR
ncbi:MAG: cytochrome c [Gemmatimonadaceae bacterium]